MNWWFGEFVSHAIQDAVMHMPISEALSMTGCGAVSQDRAQNAGL